MAHSLYANKENDMSSDDLSNYNSVMRMMEAATDPVVLAFLDRRATYYETRLGLA
jgi:hypothetical protein